MGHPRWEGVAGAVLAALDALTPAQLVALDAACASDGNADSVSFETC